MKFALQLGYWGFSPPANHAELVAAAEDAGFDAVFTAEAWGSGLSRRWRGGALGRSGSDWAPRWLRFHRAAPTACAMMSLTLDHLSCGRHILGLGVSGPQIVEGWYGQPLHKPLFVCREP